MNHRVAQSAIGLGIAVMGLALLAATPLALHAADVAPILVVDPGNHTAPIRQIAVDATESLLVTAADDKSARVWQVATGKLLATLRPPAGQDQVGRLYGVAVSAEGRLAVAGTTAGPGGKHRIYLYDLASRAFDKAIDARGGDIKRLQWSPDGRLLVAAYAGSPAVRAFDAAGKLVYEESLPADAWSLAFSSRGRMAVPVSDKSIRLYTIAGGAVAPDGVIAAGLADPRGVHFSPDGKLLAVGYQSRASRQSVQVDVFDVDARKLAKSFAFGDVTEGNLRSVAWQSDGSAIYAAGSGYRGRNTFVAKRIAWPQGTSSDIVVATNSIFDLLPLKDGRMLFATVEPSWGVLQGVNATTTVPANSAQFYEASVLKINRDATRVAWSMRPGSNLIHFDLAQRRIVDGAGEATIAPAASVTGVPVSDWENTYTPKVGGAAVPMQPTEISRAIAVLPDRSGLILGTSRTLRRLDAGGRQIWSIALSTEARAVNVTADGKVVVVGAMDGTIAWRRTSDGAMLLSLFATPDGKWVLWSEQGYYDAGIGAESLIGWLVNRANGDQADFHDISRFRDTYFRPDVIDRVLSLQDGPKALAAANADRQRLAMQADAAVQQRVEKLIAPQPVIEMLPPVVTLAAPAVVASTETTVSVPYKVLNPDAVPVIPISIRIDGRPYDGFRNQLPARFDGEAVGVLQIAMPQKDAIVQIFASNAKGTSAPAAFDFRWIPPPIEAPAPALSVIPPPLPAPPVKVDKRPTLYVLAVGVGKYANADYNLPLAAKDARDFVAAFRQQSGRFYKSVEVRLLDNEQATRKAVIEGLKWLKDATGPDDVGVLYLAGHGVNDVDNTYYLATHDSDMNRLSTTGVPESEFRDALAGIKGKTVFFVDTCYAGKSMGKLTETDLTRIANKFSSPEFGVVIFSASTGKQESLESAAWGNGAFTKAVVAGVNGAADYRKQGIVTHRGLDYYVGYEVTKLTQGKQTPVTMVPVGVADFGLASTRTN